ncbi:MAG: cell division protein FtsI/penicillin-binding protein 2 [Candidatus Paceibacteria bacterium]
MSRPSFSPRTGEPSPLGLRPTGAYLMIGLVLAIVCGEAWNLTHNADNKQPQNSGREEFLPTPDFDIADSRGRVFARSVQCMNLVLSPRAMWQAHTPRRIAEHLAPFVGAGLDSQDLLDRFLPEAAADGGRLRITREGWKLDYEQAERLDQWTRKVGIQDYLWVEGGARAPEWQLNWLPADLLAREVRECGERTDWGPLRWTRYLADGIAQARTPLTVEQRKELSWEDMEERRADVWEAFLPCANTVAVRDLPAASVVGLMMELDAEGVAKHQMSISFEHKRVYPIRSQSPEHEAFTVMGFWRYPSEQRAMQMAIEEGVHEEQLSGRARQLLDAKIPGAGLELVASKLLAGDDFNWIQAAPASYRFRQAVAVHQGARRYFQDDTREGLTPCVVSTIDSELQGYLHKSLKETQLEHRAALVMGVVMEVATGNVLAVGGTASKAVSEFLPTWHIFTPGSTFKVVVMATALEAGVVEYDTPFDTFNGAYRIPNSGRTIHEAEGAPRGKIEAWEGLSRSVNTVLVQIGMLVPAPFFHQHMLDLGYTSISHAGVGLESRGVIPDLPWKPAYDHASVSFGHQLTVSLWQHAGALATILRGGVRRPLRLMSGVQLGEEEFELPLKDGQRVYRRDVCETVRAMLAEGAKTGTGRHINNREKKLGTPIELLSKTGTTEKELGVPCLHLELKRNQMNAGLDGGSKHPDFVDFQQMKAWPIPHAGSCYTSSICLVGRVAGEEREVMVMLVVEEPRADRRFGSEVAGPAAALILKEALGLNRGGVSVTEATQVEMDYGYTKAHSAGDEPWRLRSDEDMASEGVLWQPLEPGSAR